MKKVKTQRIRHVAVVAAACLVGVSAAAVAADAQVKAAVSEQVKTEKSAQASEKKIAKLGDETSAMLVEYRQAYAELQSQKAYDDQLATQVKSQVDDIASMQRQIDQIEATAKGVLPLMQKMVATLEKFVSMDAPFLLEERTKRVESLKVLMARADVSTAEKYRRILEAYQIESEYGRTIEAYDGQIGDKTVEFLRAGRVAVLYQTLDGKETGYWDSDADQWVADDTYQMAMEEGLKVAKKQTAPDFVEVAVRAPREVK